jgi:hypothetical protein
MGRRGSVKARMIVEAISRQNIGTPPVKVLTNQPQGNGGNAESRYRSEMSASRDWPDLAERHVPLRPPSVGTDLEALAALLGEDSGSMTARKVDIENEASL